MSSRADSTSEPVEASDYVDPSVAARDPGLPNWGAREVVFGGLAMLCLTVGVIVAIQASSIPGSEIEDSIGDTTVTTLVVIAVALVAAHLALFAWLALRSVGARDLYVLPVAAGTFLVAGAMTFVDPSLGFWYEFATFVVATSVAIYGLNAYVAFRIAGIDGGVMRMISRLEIRLPNEKRQYAVALGIYAVAFLAVTLWALMLDAVNAPDWLVPPDNASDILDRSGLLLTAIAVVILAPIGEEIVFRGFAFSGLKAKLGVFGAILVTSAVFSVIHIGPDVGVGIIPPTFLLGVAFAFIYYRTRSLILAIAAHALHNGIAIAALSLADTAL